MTSPEAMALEAQRGVLVQQLSQGLLRQAPIAELQALQALQARLQLIDGALASAALKRSAFRPQLIAVLVVGAIVSAAAPWPMPRVGFTLEIEAGAAQLQMGAAGYLAGQPLGSDLRVEGDTRLESADPDWRARGVDGAAGQLSLQSERLQLRRIAHPAGAHIDIAVEGRGIRLGLDGQPHSAEFELGGRCRAGRAMRRGRARRSTPPNGCGWSPSRRRPSCGRRAPPVRSGSSAA